MIIRNADTIKTVAQNGQLVEEIKKISTVLGPFKRAPLPGPGPRGGRHCGRWQVMPLSIIKR